jgi:hypothetical protein
MVNALGGVAITAAEQKQLHAPSKRNNEPVCTFLEEQNDRAWASRIYRDFSPV